MLDINAIFGENFPDRLMIVQADRVLEMHTPHSRPMPRRSFQMLIPCWRP